MPKPTEATTFTAPETGTYSIRATVTDAEPKGSPRWAFRLTVGGLGLMVLGTMVAAAVGDASSPVYRVALMGAFWGFVALVSAAWTSGRLDPILDAFL